MSFSNLAVMFLNASSENTQFKMVGHLLWIINFNRFKFSSGHIILKLTGVVCCWYRTIYKTVGHLAEDDAHERKHDPIGHRHHSPQNKHYNVPPVCKPELKSE